MRANQFFCFLSGGGGSRGVTSRSADIFTLHFIQAFRHSGTRRHAIGRNFYPSFHWGARSASTPGLNEISK